MASGTSLRGKMNIGKGRPKKSVLEKAESGNLMKA